MDSFFVSEINHTADNIFVGNRERCFCLHDVSLLFVIMTTMSVLNFGVTRTGSFIS